MYSNICVYICNIDQFLLFFLQKNTSNTEASVCITETSLILSILHHLIQQIQIKLILSLIHCKLIKRLNIKETRFIYRQRKRTILESSNCLHLVLLLMVWITHETTASLRIIQQLRREDNIKTELYFNGAALLSNHCY